MKHVAQAGLCPCTPRGIRPTTSARACVCLPYRCGAPSRRHHGYSARDYGFRFDIDVDSGSEDGNLSYREGARVGPLDGEVKEGGPPPIHPHAGDPLLVEDPGLCVCVCLTYIDYHCE